MGCSWKREFVDPTWVRRARLKDFELKYADFVHSERKRGESSSHISVLFPSGLPVFSYYNMAWTASQTGLVDRVLLEHRLDGGITMTCSESVLEAMTLRGETLLRMPFSTEVVSYGEGTEGKGQWSVYSLADWQFSALVSCSTVLQEASRFSRHRFRTHGIKTELEQCVSLYGGTRNGTIWHPVFRCHAEGVALYESFVRNQGMRDFEMPGGSKLVASTEHVYATYAVFGRAVRRYNSLNSIVVVVDGHEFAESDYVRTPRSDRDRLAVEFAPDDRFK